METACSGKQRIWWTAMSIAVDVWIYYGFYDVVYMKPSAWYTTNHLSWNLIYKYDIHGEKKPLLYDYAAGNKLKLLAFEEDLYLYRATAPFHRQLKKWMNHLHFDGI